MSKFDDVKKVLHDIGMPQQQCSDVCCYTILSMARICKDDSWNNASNNWMRIHDIIQFAKEFYDVNYAENSRETFRKQALHHFRIAAVVEDNGKSTNSPLYSYRLTNDFLHLVKQLSSNEYISTLQKFNSEHEKLKDIYESKKKIQLQKVFINGEEFNLSSGKHNLLQKRILEDFAPRFAPNSQCLYLGDSTERDLYKNERMLNELNFDITLHEKMPDIVLYRSDKNWLYFIEAVTSVGPFSPKRIIEIENMTKNVKSGKIYITAFPDISTYKKFVVDLAWETEIWIADNPDHMIHMNGNKFMGPR